jgi:hypothetical protein
VSFSLVFIFIYLFVTISSDSNKLLRIKGYVFPALIAIFVPFRSFIVSKFFTEEDLKHLDPVGESDEDYFEEQVEINKADRDVDEAETFHGFSEFRTGNVSHDPVDHYEHHPEVEPPAELRNRVRSKETPKQTTASDDDFKSA